MRRALCLILLLCACHAAYSEIHESRYFSIDVPEGWTLTEEDSLVNIMANDGTGALMIKSGSLVESLDKIAIESSRELGGTLPVKDSEDIYTFTFAHGEEQGHVMLTGDSDFYMLITCTGLEQSGDVLLSILDSLEMK